MPRKTFSPAILHRHRRGRNVSNGGPPPTEDTFDFGDSTGTGSDTFDFGSAASTGTDTFDFGDASSW